jgi:prepilin-type processing-associated H-X9-DG protein
MKQMQDVMQFYTPRDKYDHYPRLTPRLDRLAPDPGAEGQFDLKGVGYSDPPISREVIHSFFVESNYYYLGYAVSDDDEVELFAKEFKRAFAAGKPLDYNIPKPGKPGPGEHPVLYPLLEGVERAFVFKFGYGPGNPDQERGSKARLPTLIEHVGRHGDSAAHVVYMDGHVEYLTYPGKWPMTVKTVQLLQELDDLGQAAR